MKRILTCVAVGAAVAMAGTADAKFKRVKKEADFIAVLTGKTMVSAEGIVGTISADGTFKGKLKDGRKYYGNWKRSQGYWCRAGVFDGAPLPSDCQKIEVDGSAYRLTRKKGKGKATTGTLK